MARALVAEAIQAQLLPPQPDEPDLPTALALLSEALESGPQTLTDLPSEETLALLEREREGLRTQYNRIRAQIGDLKALLTDSGDYLRTARDQHDRLASLGLFTIRSDDPKQAACPLCASPITPAHEIAAQIRNDLARLDDDVAFVSDDTARTRTLIEEAQEQQREINAALVRNRNAQQELTAGMRQANTLPNQALRAASVQGRISLYLETAALAQTTPSVPDRTAALAQRIGDLKTLSARTPRPTAS